MNEQFPAASGSARETGSARVAKAWARLQGLSPEEQIDRLAGDAALVSDLRDANWSGPEWEFVANILAQYGLAVIGAWMRTGVLEAKCRERKVLFRPLPDWIWSSETECEDLAADVVAHALRKFQREILPQGKWDPSRGASLTTYFVGQCLFQYGNATGRWWSLHQGVEGRTVPIDALREEDAPSVEASEAEDAVLTKVIILELLSRRPARNRRAMEMTMFGYSQREIAAELQMTEAAVAMMLSRERKVLEASAREEIESRGGQL